MKQSLRFMLLLVLSSGLAWSNGRIIFVDRDAPGSGTGTSWQNAFRTLVQGLDSARQLDQIWVAEGVYTPGTSRTSSFHMKAGVAIFGGFDGTEDSLVERDWVFHPTILSGDIGTPGQAGDNCYHVVSNTSLGLDSSAVLDGFTVSGGNANGGSFPDERGGGMLNLVASPTIRKCIFEGNTAGERGGGIQNVSSSPKFLDCLIQANSAFEGGGMANYAASPILQRVRFFANDGAYGGGLCNDQGSSPLLEDCVFELNSVFDSGGAMSMHEGCDAIVRRCVFRANIAEEGSAGAVWHWYAGVAAHPLYTQCLFELNYNSAFGIRNSGLRIENSVFVDNVDPDHDGGAMLVSEDSAPILVNCTFSNNWAGRGRAIALNYNPSRPSRLIAVNCVFWDGGSEIVNDDNSTIVVAHSDIYGGYSGTANISANPLFVDELHHDFCLSATSPAIDGGTAQFSWNGIPIVSLDSTRYFGSAPDMGAFEWRGGTTLAQEPETHPKELTLEQNYPNPFNPVTTIRYAIPVGTHGRTSLRVYDLLGREVATLLNETLQPGTYTVQFDASSLATGVYFYRLNTEDFSSVKKLMVLK